VAPPKRRKKLQAESFDTASAVPKLSQTPATPADETLDKALDLVDALDEPSPAGVGKERSLRLMQARITVHGSVLLASGSGLMPLPLLDAVAVTAVQIRMMKKLAALYDMPFSVGQGRWLIRSLGSYVVNTTSLWGVAGFSKLIPGIGTVLGVTSMTLVAGAFTYALGGVLIRHFEGEGDLESLNPQEHRTEFRREFNEVVEPKSAHRNPPR